MDIDCNLVILLQFLIKSDRTMLVSVANCSSLNPLADNDSLNIKVDDIGVWDCK